MRRILATSVVLYAVVTLAPGIAVADDYRSLTQRANAAGRTGQYKQALKLYQQALSQVSCTGSDVTSMDQLNRDDPCRRIVVLLFNIAVTQKRLGNDQHAAAAYQTYIAQLKAKLPQMVKRPLFARAHFEAGAALFRLRRFRDALSYFRSALSEIGQPAQPGAPKFVDDTELMIAEALKHLDRRKQAADALESMLSNYRARRGKEHPDREHWRGEIAKLRAPKPASVPKTVVIREPAKSNVWLTLALASAGLALASEGLAIGFVVRGNNKFENDPSIGTDKAVSITGHVLAGAFAITSAIFVVLQVRNSGSAKKDSSATTFRWGIGPTGAQATFAF